MNTTRYLGTTDEVTTCDCCGKSGLKKTVALCFGEGDVLHYGVTCAARSLQTTAAEVRASARRADEEAYRAKCAAEDAKRQAAFKIWSDWLERNGSGACVFTRIQSLGGMPAARARFLADGHTWD